MRMGFHLRDLLLVFGCSNAVYKRLSACSEVGKWPGLSTPYEGPDFDEYSSTHLCKG